MDEVALIIRGQKHYLWRAVDQHGNVLDIMVQSRRNKKAAKKFFRKLRKAFSAFGNWRHEILAFFDFLPTRLSNGFVEVKNDRTKAMIRQGYGYRSRHNLRLRILLEEAS